MAINTNVININRNFVFEKQINFNLWVGYTQLIQ